MDSYRPVKCSLNHKKCRLGTKILNRHSGVFGFGGVNAQESDPGCVGIDQGESNIDRVAVDNVDDSKFPVVEIQSILTE